MIFWLFQIVMVWHAVLILLLLLYALGTRKLVDRLIAFDALSIVFVAALSVVGIQRQETYYLDIALVIAMLGFVQTVAAVRLLERRRYLE
jgi:multisubunit Na+/H+ antiporter MnhF subunit